MYEAPSLEELSQAWRAAFQAEVPGSDPWVFPNTFYVMAKVLAARDRMLYQRLALLHRQARVVTAEGGYLDLHGADRGLTRRSALFAAGSASFTTDLANAVPAGTRLVRGDGRVFITDHDVTPVVSPSQVSVRALESGIRGNTLPSAPLTLETPIAGVGAFTVGAAGLVGGVDAETDASFRQRILDVLRNPPHGGSPGEFKTWALQVAGVTRVFIQRATPEPGSVTVLAMMDDSIYSDGIPGPADVARVESHLATVAPSAAKLVVAAPVAVPVNVTLSALAPDTAAVREAITLELRAMFRRRAEPGTAAADFTFSKSWVSEAISLAAGEASHTITAPAADVACGDGEIAVLGTVTFP